MMASTAAVAAQQRALGLAHNLGCCCCCCWLVRDTQALASQATSHTEALGQLTQQYQDVCARLAAASSEQGELQQQLARSQQENQQLQQQARQLQQQVQQVGTLHMSLCCTLLPGSYMFRCVLRTVIQAC